MLEIIGYEGIAFDTLPALGTTPWHNLTIEKVNIVYFAPLQINDHVIDNHDSRSLLGALIDIAIERCEINDFMAGFQHAMELMPASLHRHTAINRQRIPGRRAQPNRNQNNENDPDDILDNLNHNDAGGVAVENVINLNVEQNDDEFRYPYLDERIQTLPPDAPALQRQIRRPHHANPDNDNYVGDLNVANVNTHREQDWTHVPLDAYLQFMPSNLAKPMGDNWFYTMLGIHRPHTSETLPPFLLACNNLDLMRVMCLGFAIISASSTSVSIAFNIIGAHLDAFNRAIAMPAFASWYRMFMTTASTDVYMQAPYFAFITHVVTSMTGHKMFLQHIMRTFNRDITYQHFADRYGVYHFLTGQLPIRTNSVLCIDNFIKLRPREWGIFIPNVTGKIRDNVDFRLDEPNVLRVITHLGTDGWFKLWRQPVNRHIGQPFCALLLNAVLQSEFSGVNQRPRLNYWFTSASMITPNVSWRPAGAIEDYPPPLYLEDINIIEPGTILGFNWTAGYYLAPALLINGPIIPRILSARTLPEHTFDGAGIVLKRVNEGWQFSVSTSPMLNLHHGKLCKLMHIMLRSTFITSSKDNSIIVQTPTILVTNLVEVDVHLLHKIQLLSLMLLLVHMVTL